jgi:hypothetical protein
MESPRRRCWPMQRMAMKRSFGNSSANWAYLMLLACAGPQQFDDLEKLHSRQNQEAGWGAHRNCCAGIETINVSVQQIALSLPAKDWRAVSCVKGRSRNCTPVLRPCECDLPIGTTGEANLVTKNGCSGVESEPHTERVGEMSETPLDYRTRLPRPEARVGTGT